MRRLTSKGDRGIDLHVDQIGIIVAELDSAVEQYGRTFAIADWHGWSYDEQTMTTSTFRGGPGQFSMDLALGGSGPQIELIDPGRGPSIYHEHLDELGPGLHHVGCIVESLGSSIPLFKGAGYELLQSGAGYGLRGDGGFAYFDTVRDYSVLLELIELPEERRAPDFAWQVEA